MIAHGEAWAVVVAAGRGERFGADYNKVFHPIRGRSILSRSLDALFASGAFAGAVLVLSPSDIPAYHRLVQAEGACPLVRTVTEGGLTRQQSVYRGLRALPEGAEVVAVHDAARPFASAELVRACVQSAREHGSGVPAMPVYDTIHEVDEQGRAIRALQRERLRAVQTPQAFLLKPLLEAHERFADEPATDDAALYQRAFGPVHLVVHPDCEHNIKITTPRDAEQATARFVVGVSGAGDARAEEISSATAEAGNEETSLSGIGELDGAYAIARPAPAASAALHAMRMGAGYDAHRLVEGRALVLCGVHVPYEKGLLGHSDADVATHALMDALLGAMALGDIGRHFPDSDSRYKGISSMELLLRVASMMRERGYRLVNADVTIVAQRPRLAPYMPEMVANLALALDAKANRINVKATTTEGMGFEGEGLGISAQATALIAREQA